MAEKIRTEEARQGRVKNVRYILVASLVLAVIAVAVVGIYIA